MTANLFPAKGRKKFGSPQWGAVQEIPQLSYTCGFCGKHISNRHGYYALVTYDTSGLPNQRGNSVQGAAAYIYVCHICGGPTYFSTEAEQLPIGIGERVFVHVPPDLVAAYQQSIRCLKAGCLEACVMVARRLLMVLAWRLNADEGKKFVEYVNHLVAVGAISAPMKVWVDKIREIGNAATHEIPSVTGDDAKIVVRFVELVFDNVFEAAGGAGVASPFSLRP